MKAANIKRAKRARNVVDAYSEHALLADMRHLCDREGFDFYYLDKAAYSHYNEERNGGGSR